MQITKNFIILVAHSKVVGFIPVRISKKSAKNICDYLRKISNHSSGLVRWNDVISWDYTQNFIGNIYLELNQKDGNSKAVNNYKISKELFERYKQLTKKREK